MWLYQTEEIYSHCVTVQYEGGACFWIIEAFVTIFLPEEYKVNPKHANALLPEHTLTPTTLLPSVQSHSPLPSGFSSNTGNCRLQANVDKRGLSIRKGVATSEINSRTNQRSGRLTVELCFIVGLD